MEIVIGTYEEFLVGYTLSKKKGKYHLTQSFTNHAHCGSVRSVASSSKYLVSGSVDEVIHIISMKHRIDSGTLVSHTGTITALEFLRSAFLFSASEDGNICIWNTRKWECEKVLRGHKEAVNSLSIHSSGKLLISVSKDKSLRTWNLIKGRCAYIVNLKDIAHQVLWSPSCIYFAVVFDYHADIYDISTGGVLHSIEKSVFSHRINKLIFIDDNTVLLCGDCNDLVIYELSSKRVVNRFTAHENRIKDLTFVDLKNVDPELFGEDAADDNDRWLVTTSSDGFIKIWSFDFSNLESDPTLVAQVNSTCRPTCMTVWTSNQNPNGKFDKFSIPELKISKEELEVCKSKIKEKKTKRKLAQSANNDEGVDEEESKELAEDDDDDRNSPKPAKKAKFSKKKNKKNAADDKAHPEEQIELVPSQPQQQINQSKFVDEDDDDEEAIRNMKANSKSYQQMSKFKKNNKRNITTFKQRQQQKRDKKSNGFKESTNSKESKRDSFGKNQKFKGQNKNNKPRPFRTFNNKKSK